jgi:pimeloyl-ACP methyl ester carboxylesterase
VAAARYYERSGTVFPSLLRTVQASQTYAGPRSTDPEAMARSSVPVLLLRGQQTRRAAFYTDTEQYVAEHVPDPHVRGLPGVGHFAPTVAPEPVAEALVSYFGSVRKPA